MLDLVLDATSIQILRLWSYVNTKLIKYNKSNYSLYCTQAIHALAQCVKVNPSFTDIVQLLDLFFEYADDSNIFESTNPILRNISPNLLLQTSPQILVQLSHHSSSVSKFVNEIVLDLLKDHYHEFIFSIYVLTLSENAKRSQAALNIINEFKNQNPDACK